MSCPDQSVGCQVTLISSSWMSRMFCSLRFSFSSNARSIRDVKLVRLLMLKRWKYSFTSSLDFWEIRPSWRIQGPLVSQSWVGLWHGSWSWSKNCRRLLGWKPGCKSVPFLVISEIVSAILWIASSRLKPLSSRLKPLQLLACYRTGARQVPDKSPIAARWFPRKFTGQSWLVLDFPDWVVGGWHGTDIDLCGGQLQGRANVREQCRYSLVGTV